MRIKETNFKFSSGLKKRLETNYIILHHRAGSGDIESIHEQHLKRAYIGIGYHYYIRKDGSIYSGRPENTVGAHCLNYNIASVGVCFEGNFENEHMTEAQKNAGRELVNYLKNTYPSAKVVRHKDMMSTACPGRYFPFDEICEEEIMELISANDITWELSQRIKIHDVDGFVKALDKAKEENSPLYWGYYKIVNR